MKRVRFVIRALLLLMTVVIPELRCSSVSDLPAAGCPASDPRVSKTLGAIMPSDLKADLFFLSSDALEGRFSPSPGLDAAAEFIASRFLGDGLEPGWHHEFFQPAVLQEGIPKEPGPELQPGQGRVKNVIAVLRGSDPKLKDTYVLLSAHYDHIGTIKTAGREAADHPRADSPDEIYNGANDDGSGTVSVIAIAKALAKIRPRPKRSIVFVLFFGEELGLRGSQYYAQHPAFPLSETVADLNLEQLGRTDSTEGPQVDTASLTGIGYSDVPSIMRCAGLATGVKIYLDKGNDEFFTRSDNASFARRGVPAHTLCVAFDFPDYHRLGDEWQKLDYVNMAKIDRMIALGVLDLANDTKRPEWNSANPKAEPFRKAQAKLQEH
jgi:hypothetical protein